MEFGPSQSPAPTPPRPLHRWANEGRGWALCWRNCTDGRIQLGHGHYAHPIWMGARGRVRSTHCAVDCAHNGGSVLRTRPSFGLYSTQEFVPYARVCTKRFGSAQMGVAQWAVPNGRCPTDQLAQFGTKRAKRGAGGLGAFGPNSGRPQFLLS